MAVKRTENSPKQTADISKQIDITMNDYKVGMSGGIENMQVTLNDRSDMT